jgi:hypothetical protein
MHALLRRAALPASLIALASVGSAQESKAPLDAPFVMWGPTERVEHLIDLNHDMRKDALSWWFTDSAKQGIRLHGWINTPDNTFTKAWEVGLSTNVANNDDGPPHPAVGDVDGDGWLDFAVNLAHTIAVYRSNGAASPGLLGWVHPGNDIADLALPDFNGDGLADMVLRTVGGLVRVYLNQGPAQGWKLLEVSSKVVGAPLSVMRVAELTGDSVPDLLFVYGTTMSILPIAADGSIGQELLFTGSLWTKPRPVVGDIDGDRDLDIAVFDGFGQQGFYEVWRRTGPSSFVHEWPGAGGPCTELFDIDLDGDLDGICCGGGGGTGGGPLLNTGKSTFNVCFNDGSGAFTKSFQMRGVGSSHIAGAADIDLDGDIDLVAGRAIYYARGLLKAPPIKELPGPLLSPGELVDYDGDGDLDARLTPSQVLRSNGNDTYDSYSPLMPAPPPGSTFWGPGYPGDFDGDGDEDLLVARFDGASFGSMQLLANLGGGHFVDAGPASNPGVCFSLTGKQNLETRWGYGADLNLDGDLDLVTSGAGSKAWMNDGSGFLRHKWSSNLYVMAVVRLDSDAIPDAILGGASSMPSQTNIYWSKGVGDGTFAGTYQLSGPFFVIRPQYDRIAVADFDADGDFDVVGLNHQDYSPGATYYWKNVGGSNAHAMFTNELLPQGHEPEEGVLSAVAGDVDGDGRQDLLTWPTAEGQLTCAVWLRASDGQSFLPPRLQCLSPLAIADVDSDGDADAIGIAWSTTDNVLVRARTIDGSAVGLRRQYGEGSPGSGGYAPVLGATGPFRVGETFELRVRGGLGGANVVIGVGPTSSALANVPYPGLTAYAWPAERRMLMKLSGPAGVPGIGSATLTAVVPPSLAGVTYFHQVFVVDPGGSGGLSCSNGLELAYD